MPLTSRIASLFRNLVHRAQVDRELDDELRAYVDALTEEKARGGLTADRARRAALAEVGGLQQVKERVRAVRTGVLIEQSWHHLRLAARTVARRPAMSALLVITTGLGIGAATAVFTVVDSALLRRPAFRNPDELVELWNRDPAGRSYPRLDAERAAAWSNQSALFAGIERYTVKTMLLGGADEPREVRVAFVSAGMFPMLGVTPATGRAFGAGDARADTPSVAVVSEELWRRQGPDPGSTGARRIRLDDREYAVIGAMPASFRFPRGDDVAIWAPLPDGVGAQLRSVNVVGRLRGPMSERQAQQRFDAFAAQLMNTSPRKEGWGVTPHSLTAPTLDANGRRALWVLSGAVICVLLVACVNAANLLLVQATGRQRELEVRLALGATRTRLVADLLMENIALAALAATLGLAIANWSVVVMLRVAPPGLVDVASGSVGVDGRVLAFAMVATLVSWLLCSVAPAWQALNTRQSLVAGARGASAGGGLKRVRSALVIGELAISLVLLAGAGLFTRSLQQLLAVNPGFDVEHVVFADLGMAAGPERGPEERAALLDAIEQRIRGVPGVRSVALATGLPPHAPTTLTRLEAENGTEPMRDADLAFTEVDTAFFSSVGVPILHGRQFGRDDLSPESAVVVINASLARALWPAQDPVGRRLRLAQDGPWHTVVGVAGDLKLVGPDDRSSPYAMYYPRPTLGRATRVVSMVIRTAGDPRASLTAIRDAIHRARPDQPISRLALAGVAFAESMERPRFIGALVLLFAMIAVLLAGCGVYGVFSYAVVRRTREIGIRMALGAQRVSVIRSLMGEGILLSLAGVVLGLAGIAASSRAIASLLFGVGPGDPPVLFAAALVLVAMAMVATLVPTLRASRISPMVAISLD